MAKPPSLIKSIVVEVDETYNEKAERAFIPTGSHSLMESIRNGLPDTQGAPEQLVYIAQYQPAIYSTLLGKLIAGSSFKAASLAIGIPVQRIYNWLTKGSADLADEQDSFCSRFLLDCQRDQALSVSDAEVRVN